MTKSNIFISDCANFIAIRVTDNVPLNESFHFDVISVDGSKIWRCARYVKNSSGDFLPRSFANEGKRFLFLEERYVGGWGNKYRGAKEGFKLYLYQCGTDEYYAPEFHRVVKSLAPHHKPICKD